MFQGPPRLIRMAVVAAAGTSCLAAAACGSSASSSTSAAATLSIAPTASTASSVTAAPSASASANASTSASASGAASGSAAPSTTASASASSAPSASVAADPLAGLTGTQVATRALANLKAESSLTMTGTFSQSGQSYTVNLGLEPGQGCTGTIGEGSKGSFKLIVIGTTLYFNPDDTFWKSAGGANASTVIALVNGRYIKTSTSGSMASLASLCNLSQTLGAIAVTGTFTKGTPTTLDGTLVLPLGNTAGTGTMDVTDRSVPEVVSMTDPKTGALTFSPGAPVTLAAPPASQVIDGAQLGI
jgi:hypothetical protein